MADRGLDALALLSDRPREARERREPTAPGPLKSAIEQDDGVLVGDAVDLAQLLGEQIGAEEALVDLLDAGELQLLALGQPLGVLPEREARALQLARELALALAAGLVPDLAADLIERVGRELYEVERVEADRRVGAAR